MGTASWKAGGPPLSSPVAQAQEPVSPLCRQLAEVVQERYLSGVERAKRHGVLADFFSGAWSQGTKKLVTLPLVGKPLNLDRMVRCLPGVPALYLQSPPCRAGKVKAAWRGPPAPSFLLFHPECHPDLLPFPPPQKAGCPLSL